MNASSPEPRGRWLFAALAGSLAVSAAAWLGIRHWLDTPLPLRESVVVELPEGGNLTRFLADLRVRGIVLHPAVLRLHARQSGVADRVRAGEYRLEPGLSPRGLLRKLVEGDVVEYALTVVEGSTLQQMLTILHAQPKLRRTLDASDMPSLRTILNTESGERSSAEGLFFPDTYHYHRGMDDADLLRIAHRRMMSILEEEWRGRAPSLPYRDAYEALVMASLVERETGQADERARIAGVFVRRLRLGMRLQTDPAVIYGVGDAFDGDLTREHLRTPGPYNTYLNTGLPPTPIALPGREAIRAALNPADGEELYFVARGDGSHVFSVTLDEHNRAVRRYQLGKRKETRP